MLAPWHQRAPLNFTGDVRLLLYRLRSGVRAQVAPTLALAVVVALAGGTVLTLFAGAARTLTASDRYVASQGIVFDVLVEQPHGRPRAHDLTALPAVRAVRTITFVFGGLVPAGADAPADVLVFAGSQEAFGTRMIAGRVPNAAAPNEFIASRSFVETTGSAIGDELQLVTIGQATADVSGFDVATPDGPTLAVTLVGIFTGPTELQDGYAFALFPPSLLDVGDIGISASQHAVAIRPGATVADLRQQLDGLSGGPFGIDPADLVPAVVRDAVDARGKGIAFVAAILAVAVVAVLGQLLGRRSQLSEQQRSALGALGLTRRQLVADSVARAAPPIVVGSMGAAGLAIAVSGVFPLGFVADVEPHPGLRLEPWVHLAGALALSLLLVGWVVLAVAVGSRHGTRGDTSRLVSSLALRTRTMQMATALRFAFTRQGHDSSPPVAPLAGLSLVLGGLVAALVFGASLARVIDDPERWGGADLGIGAGGDQVDPALEAALQASPDVEALMRGGSVLAAVGTTSFDVVGLEPVRGDLWPPLLAGRLPVADDEIVLGRSTARDLGVSVGDGLTVKAAGGEVRLQVTGLAVIPGMHGADGVGSGGVVTASGLRHIDPTATMPDLAVKLRADARSGAVERVSAALGRPVGPMDRPSVILNLDRVRALPLVVAGTLGLLAALSLAHLLILSARNRRRDVAILGALGADRRWVTSVVHQQATMTAGVVLVAATPLGIGLGRVIYRAFIDRVGTANDTTLSVWALVGTVAATLVLANVVAAVPARRARNQPLAPHLNAE